MLLFCRAVDGPPTQWPVLTIPFIPLPLPSTSQAPVTNILLHFYAVSPLFGILCTCFGIF